jgi:hypothetical protein
VNVDITGALSALAARRPIFHSEREAAEDWPELAEEQPAASAQAPTASTATASRRLLELFSSFMFRIFPNVGNGA